MDNTSTRSAHSFRDSSLFCDADWKLSWWVRSGAEVLNRLSNFFRMSRNVDGDRLPTKECSNYWLGPPWINKMLFRLGPLLVAREPHTLVQECLPAGFAIIPQVLVLQLATRCWWVPTMTAY